MDPASSSPHLGSCYAISSETAAASEGAQPLTQEALLPPARIRPPLGRSVLAVVAPEVGIHSPDGAGQMVLHELVHGEARRPRPAVRIVALEVEGMLAGEQLPHPVDE